MATVKDEVFTSPHFAQRIILRASTSQTREGGGGKWGVRERMKEGGRKGRTEGRTEGESQTERFW